LSFLHVKLNAKFAGQFSFMSEQLTNISPIDGRYASKTKELSPYFSEFGLIKYRVLVEIEYFIALTQIPLPQLADFPTMQVSQLKNIVEDFSVSDALIIKETEKTTNHDVKAVEYFLKTKFDELSLDKWKEFIHFGLTSQDINNTAIPLSFKAANEKLFFRTLHRIIGQINQLAEQWADVAMLARTHGQPASPTRLGKELAVFVERLNQQLTLFNKFHIAQNLVELPETLMHTT
jgi:adenylosuccinate lyase